MRLANGTLGFHIFVSWWGYTIVIYGQSSLGSPFESTITDVSTDSSSTG